MPDGANVSAQGACASSGTSIQGFGALTAYCNMRREKGYHLLDMEDKTSEEAEMCKTALDKSREIEEAYNKEDEDMMIRLIKIRESLWT